ncbi:MAG: archaetidylserine decarboxylase [Pseudomonadales bacterium]
MDTLFIWLQYLLPQHLLSRLAARFANSETRWLKTLLIRRFIKTYNVNMEEAAAEADSYPSFNAFFTRALKVGARPVADVEKFILSPADGAISQVGCIESGRILQAKGQHYSVSELLAGDREMAEKYRDGLFITIYLSPRDYHRVHMPISGTLKYTTYVPGDLFSVNHATASHVPRLFARNERLICVFDTELGKVTSVMVGAMIVAGIATVWAGPVTAHGKEIQTSRYLEAQTPPTLAAGAEMGRFMLGSTVILLFEAGQIEWLPELQAGSAVRMGRALARRL